MSTDCPPVPLDAFPPWLRSMVSAVAEATKTDPAMAAALSLSVVSAAVARKAFVRMPSRYTQPLGLWVLVGAGSGEGKTPVFNAVLKPLRAVQAALDSRRRTTIEGAEATPSPLQHDRYTRIVDLDVLDEAEDGLDAVTLDAVVARLVDAQERGFPGTPVRLLARDATPGALLQLMATQALGVAQVSAESGFAAWVSGASSQAQANQALLNLAWDGDTIEQDRLTREAPIVERASLSIGVAMQVDPLRDLLRDRRMRSIGFSLRFLVVTPESKAGKRPAPFTAVPTEVDDSYVRHVWAMLLLGNAPGQFIEVSADASNAYDAFYNQLESRVGPNGDLAPVRDWIEKLRSNVIRLSGILHVAEDLTLGDRVFQTEVSQATMGRAISMGNWFLEHGLTLLGAEATRGTEGPTTGAATRAPRVAPAEAASAAILTWAREVWAVEHAGRPFPKSAVTRGVRSMSAAVLDQGLARLVEQGALVQTQGIGTGGRSAVLYEATGSLPPVTPDREGSPEIP